MSEPVPNRELAGLEAGLKGLAPAPACLDRDRVFFRAGQATARRTAWPWPAAAAVLALTTGTLGLTLALRPSVQTVERIVRVEVPVPVPPGPTPKEAPKRPAAPPPSADRPEREETVVRGPLSAGYIHLRDEVVRWGADALPGPPPVDTPAAAPSQPGGAHDLRGLLDWFPGLPSPKTGGSL
jgi:hypothetical protein